MKLIPLRQWTCDSCGEVIEKPEDGWFEWYTERDTSLDTGFRIVHHRGSCMYNDQRLEQQNRPPSDFDLSMVVGHNGLALLLNLMERKKFADMKEFIEVFRRLHLPYYEEARLYWNDALRDGFHDGCSFDENTLLDIIKNYGEDR